jgi:predicted acylesterase/phospholipase RssA
VEGDESERPLAVALSGGGHRATLFGLGALLYLVDAGQGPRLGSISSISGGSLTNGYLGLHCDLATAAPDEVRGHARTLAHQVACRGTLWAGPETWAYCALVVLVPIVAALLTWRHGAAWGWLAWAGVLVADGWLAQQRSWVARRAFERTLFGRRTRLAELHATVDHVIGSTDLQTHDLVFFSGRFVTSSRMGRGRPGDLGLATAVQASAALPGPFCPVRIPVSRLDLQPTDPALRSLLLIDGGVYDNMGDQWPETSPETRQLIVVNAVPTPPVEPHLKAKWPLLGEAVTFRAVTDVLYEQTTAVRRRLLDLRFHDAAHHQADGLEGTIVQIGRTPYDSAEDLAAGHDARAARAGAVLAALDETGLDRSWWDAEAAANGRVKTALSRIAPDRAAALLHQAYVVTMADAHVLLGLPLLPIPTVEQMGELVRAPG